MKEKKYKDIVNSINDINKLLKETKVYLSGNAAEKYFKKQHSENK